MQQVLCIVRRGRKEGREEGRKGGREGGREGGYSLSTPAVSKVKKSECAVVCLCRLAPASE